MATSKSIGADAERRVAKIILSVNKELTAEDCRRTGYEQARKKGIRDLYISDRLKEVFPFSIEVKRLKRWDPFAFMRTPCPFSPWFKQTVEQAENVKLLPLLVVTATNRPCYAAYRYKDSHGWPGKATYPNMVFVVQSELWVLTPLLPFAERFLKHATFGNGTMQKRKK